MKKFLSLLLARSVVSIAALLVGVLLVCLLLWQAPTITMFLTVVRGGLVLGFIWAYFETVLTKDKPKKHWGSQ